MLLLLAGLALAFQAEAEPSSPEAKCKYDTEGGRHAIKCDLTFADQSQEWRARGKTSRKLFVSKPAGDTGVDVVRVWFKGQPGGTIEIHPGEEKQIFLKKGSSSVDAEVRISNLKLGANGKSVLYAHYEWLNIQGVAVKPCSNAILPGGGAFCVPVFKW